MMETADQHESKDEKTRVELDAQLKAFAFEEEERKRYEKRRKMRELNAPDSVSISRAAHNAGKSKLKSDLKKTSAFISKVRTLSEAQRSTILKDIETLNLSHYVSEVVDAIADAKLKTGDVGLAVDICCMMHQRYSGFTEALHVKLTGPFKDDPTEDDKEALRKRRINLRMIAELHIYGVIDASPTLLLILRRLSGEKKVQFPANISTRQTAGQVLAMPPSSTFFAEMTSSDISLIVSFAKHSGQEMTGIVPRRQENIGLIDFSRQDRLQVLPIESQAVFLGFLKSILRFLRNKLVALHKSTCKLERKMEKDRLICGTLSEEKQRNLETATRNYEKLLGNVSLLSDALDEDMPELPDEKEDEEFTAVELLSTGGSDETSPGLWDDVETKSFYEEFTDLLTAVPPSQLGLTEEQWQELQSQQISNGSRNIGDESSALDGGDAETAEDLKSLIVSTEESPIDANEDSSNNIEVEDKFEPPDDPGVAEEEDDSGSTSNVSGGQLLTILLKEELPMCYNRDRTDAFAIKFCQFNSKSARKKLAQALFDVPRQHLDLLPQYGRLVATLDRVLKDIAPILIENLRGEFRWLLHKRTAANLIDSKRRNVCFIGELIKFRVAPPIVAFQCLKSCFQEFTGSNIEMACMLLESCGRFLYRFKPTHSRIANYLETMMRFRQAKHFDQRYETMIENAYYMCKPPEGMGKFLKEKKRAPLQLWIRHLVYEKLAEDTVETVLKRLRRLPWSGEMKQTPDRNPVGETDSDLPIAVDVMDEVQKAILKTARVKVTAIHLVADVLAGLHRYHPLLTIRIVDAVAEEMQRACEEIGGNTRNLQHRIGLARFLGELYNYSLVSSGFVFDTLYNLINYGHAVPPAMKQPRTDPGTGEVVPPAVAPWAVYDPRAIHPCDPPGNCLRIRLVIQILEACTEYFVLSQFRPKLERFLTYFQRYLFCKPSLPPDTEFAVLDLLDELERQSKSAAEKEIAKLNRATQSKAAKAAGKSGKGQKGAEASQKACDVPSTPILPRFETWEEAQKAVEKIEAEEYEAAKKSGLVGNADEMEDGGQKDDEDVLDGEEDNADEDDADLNDSSAGTSTTGDSNKNEDDDDNESEHPLNDEEEEVHVYDKHEYLKTEADNEFEQLLMKMQQESMDKTKQTYRLSIKADNMDTPSISSRALVTETKRFVHSEPSVDFKLIRRCSKGKTEAVTVSIPSNTNIVAQTMRSCLAESGEREIIKARVLQYEKEQHLHETPAEPVPLLNNQPITVEAAKRAAIKGGRHRGAKGGKPHGSYRGRGGGGAGLGYSRGGTDDD